MEEIKNKALGNETDIGIFEYLKKEILKIQNRRILANQKRI